MVYYIDFKSSKTIRSGEWLTINQQKKEHVRH